MASINTFPPLVSFTGSVEQNIDSRVVVPMVVLWLPILKTLFTPPAVAVVGSICNLYTGETVPIPTLSFVASTNSVLVSKVALPETVNPPKVGVDAVPKF